MKQAGNRKIIKNHIDTSPDEMEDAYLLRLATERMAHYDPAAVIPEEEVWRELGITDADLTGYEDVEIE